MHKTWEKFIESYEKDGLPLFFIFKGSSTSGRRLKSYQKKFDEAEKEQAISDGIEVLEAFRDEYEYGDITIECMNSPRSDKSSRLYHHVQWGEKPTRTGSRSNSSGADEFQKYYLMFSAMQAPQMEMMKEMQKMREEFRDKEHERELEEAGAAQNFWEMAMPEIASCIKPGFEYLTGKKVPEPPALMNGIADGTPEQTSKDKKEKANSTKSFVGNADAISLDYVVNVVKKLQKEHFPHAHPHDLLFALYTLMKDATTATLVKSQINPIISNIVSQRRAKQNTNA